MFCGTRWDGTPGRNNHGGVTIPSRHGFTVAATPSIDHVTPLGAGLFFNLKIAILPRTSVHSAPPSRHNRSSCHAAHTIAPSQHAYMQYDVLLLYFLLKDFSAGGVGVGTGFLFSQRGILTGTCECATTGRVKFHTPNLSRTLHTRLKCTRYVAPKCTKYSNGCIYRTRPERVHIHRVRGGKMLFGQFSDYSGHGARTRKRSLARSSAGCLAVVV